MVATIEVGEDLDLRRRHGGVGFEFDRELGLVACDFIEIEAAQSVVAIGIVAVDRDNHLGIADIETSVEILVTDRGRVERLVFGNFQIVGLVAVERRGLGLDGAAKSAGVGDCGDVDDARNRSEGFD